MSFRVLACFFSLVVASRAVAADPPAEPVPDFPRVPPTEPGEALKTFRVLDGFRMELIAAEPLVADPVDLAYDPDGRAYVVEFRGYPKPEKPDDPTPIPIGRVRLLEDTDGDGTFDRSDVFADDLQWPTSVVLWKRSVFVAAPPDVWYFEGTDGDRKADVRRKVYTGFGATNIQAVMNNLRWGLDHWIYVAAAGNGGSVVPADRPGEKPVLLKRRDFRFDPETGGFEATSGGERFGNAFDDWGNRFLCNIRNPVEHVVLPSRYLDRNRHLIVASAVHDAAASGDQLPVFRISPAEPAAAGLILGEWRHLTPPVRAEAVETLLRRPAWVGPLLAAIEAGTVPPSEVPVARRNLLLTSRDESVRKTAERIFGRDAPSPRAEVVARYRESLGMEGRALEGAAVFRRECATCHRFGNEGHAVGPALETARHRSAEEILTHVLDPNREVSPEWVDYVAVLTDGPVLTGLLVAESEAGLTLRRGQGVEETVPRTQIEELTGTGRSLMPEGLERNVSPREMADLIAFLRGERPGAER